MTELKMHRKIENNIYNNNKNGKMLPKIKYKRENENMTVVEGYELSE